MVWEVIYSKNPEEALEEIENRRFDDELYSLSEEADSEFESIYNQKRKGLRIVGGKHCDKSKNGLTRKALETSKSF